MNKNHVNCHYKAVIVRFKHMDKVETLLTRSVDQILPSRQGLQKLMESKKIRVYLGIDPTGTHLHLGHTIPMKKLQEFADLGHEAILLIGTGTVLVGDPSQRGTAREKITKEEIEENIKTWQSQAKKVLDFEKVQIKYNGDWLLGLTYPEIANIASNISTIQLIKRDMFQERLKRGDTVWHHETLYPLMQGYDSVVMDVDLEIGGSDQTFNMLIGRELQKKMKNREKYVLTTPLISGTDGQPMSKSSGNCVWLDDLPTEMFGKLMSIADSQIEEYWTNLTDLPSEKLKKLKPFDAKKELAKAIVNIYYGERIAQKAHEEFENVFQKKQQPEETQVIKIDNKTQNVTDLLTKNNLALSKSGAKRLLQSGAIEIDGQTISENHYEFKDGQIIRVGKKQFVKITLG